MTNNIKTVINLPFDWVCTCWYFSDHLFDIEAKRVKTYKYWLIKLIIFLSVNISILMLFFVFSLVLKSDYKL